VSRRAALGGPGATRKALRRYLLAACLLALAACSTNSPVTPRDAAVPAALGPAATASSRDAFVLISGGGSPLTNQYSQYLQARAIAADFQRRAAPGRAWVFFGAGNRTSEAPVFGDVHQQIKRGGLLIDHWVPGPLQDNRPAKREAILRALREEVLPVVRDGGTLYLFIGDHGTESRGENPESIITLWQMERSATGGWRQNNTENLGVAELRTTLASGLGRGRVVFCMTQCHSGGFHELAVPHAFKLRPDWFTVMPVDSPDWRQAPVDLRLAGFTATDQESLAAGCMPDPDPDRWAGYERFFPEQLLGVDLFTNTRTGGGRPSFAAAHEAATLVDQTIDKPRSTADFFLDRWADAIELLAQQPNVTPELKRHVALYERIADGAAPPAGDADLAEKQAQFLRFTAELARQHPSLATVLRTAPRAELLAGGNAAMLRGGNQGGGGGAARRPPELAKLWDETIRPAWQAAIDAGSAKTLPSAAQAFEKHLLALEAKGRDFLFNREALPNETFWQSTLAQPATADAAKAAAVTRWAAERRTKILEWAKDAADEKVRTAAADWQKRSLNRRTAAVTPAPAAAARPPNAAAQRAARERVRFYRRVLGAWAFLQASDETEALEQLHALQALEHTPFPI